MSDWQPAASIDCIRRRGLLYQQVRQFFAERDVLEVDTPVLSCAAVSDPYLNPLQSHFAGPGLPDQRLFLQTSPEYAMKRLLTAGSGCIYQLAKAFRNGESGRHHNPEFCMLEWYRLDLDDHRLMDEVEDLVWQVVDHDILAAQSAERLSYRDAFVRYLDIDPHQASMSELRALAKVKVDAQIELEDRDGWLNLLISHVIEPQLQKPTFIYDYPASQAALARIDTDERGAMIARRFELFIAGIELANGYWELTAADEQAKRFEQDQMQRLSLGIQPLPTDQRLVAALQSGMPDCAGVALGIDRLLMLATGLQHIDAVLAFPISRA